MVTIHFFGPEMQALRRHFTSNGPTSPDVEKIAAGSRGSDADDAVDAALQTWC
jgi:hypothetical protein